MLLGLVALVVGGMRDVQLDTAPPVPQRAVLGVGDGQRAVVATSELPPVSRDLSRARQGLQEALREQADAEVAPVTPTALVASPEPSPPPAPVTWAPDKTGSTYDAFPEAPREWVDYVCAYWTDGCWRALRISRCELGAIWQPGVVNWASGVKGAWQIHPVHLYRFEARGWTWDDAADPYRNTDIAWEIYQEQGWGPWACALWN